MATVRRFGFSRTREVLTALLAEHDLEPDERHRSLVAKDGSLCFIPPLVQPLEQRTAGDYLRALEDALGLHLVLLVQAGATALGLWEDGELLAHKVVRKYVVRGKGRAQPTHLQSKGKSRYGSRLRLQNWKRQLEETNEKMLEWRERFGPPARKFASCPVRAWSDLVRVKPAPPYARADFHRIPVHVHAPSFDELRRVYALLCEGRIEGG